MKASTKILSTVGKLRNFIQPFMDEAKITIDDRPIKIQYVFPIGKTAYLEISKMEEEECQVSKQ